MSSKVNAVAAMIVLAILLALCHAAGTELERRIRSGETEETFKLSNKVDVIVDAGHGGADAGKTGVNGEKEKEINLQISDKIKKLLLDQGISVRMTREGDDRLADSQREDLQARVDIINSGARLAVSVHQNSYHDPAVWGAQVFYYTDSEHGRSAAGMIQEELNKLSPDHKKKIRANNTYYILKNTDIPTVIVECGFLSNHTEAGKLSDDAYQSAVAEAVVRGVLQYIND